MRRVVDDKGKVVWKEKLLACELSVGWRSKIVCGRPGHQRFNRHRGARTTNLEASTHLNRVRYDGTAVPQLSRHWASRCLRYCLVFVDT